ncbi:hypothetical protein FLGE108171_03010 [Flavobacterium gelidilacus]|jgi:uncharacterized protein YfkK (UPF0435 family)|uniref:hypothetical protein n=1 Tax=Flavobacterium gelidilacus TaxID=206041 RepID=UPI0003FFB921|nr:hypothetical protein [Flavobacterium gelidilacus]
MSTNSQDQEIDLGQLFNKVSGFFKNIINSFFNLIFFIQKKIIIIIILFIVGVALAYLADGKKNYEHEISVIPNFGSNEYLYKKIEELNTKLREGDTVFFKNIGIKDYENISSISIEAYPAIYNFINNKDQENNFELIKLMAEDGNIEKILNSEMTSKNYYHHKVTIVTKGMWKREDLIDPILTYLNKSQYFLEQQKVHQQNLEEKLIANDSLIKQVDKIISLLSSNSKGGLNVSISENSSIPELVNKKDNLISESHLLKTSKIISDKIIKEESSVLNIRKYVPLVLNSKILFPILLILFYLIGLAFLKIYNKQKLRIKQ